MIFDELIEIFEVIKWEFNVVVFDIVEILDRIRYFCFGKWVFFEVF